MNIKRKLDKFITLQIYEMASSVVNTDPTVIDHECSCNRIHTFHGGRTQKVLSRSRLFQKPGAENSMLMCAGDEATQSVSTNHVIMSYL